MSASTRDNDMRSRLVVNLPAIPQMLPKLMQYCQADDVGMAELAELIAKDAAMTATVLRVANSPIYRRGKPSSISLEHALMTIGANLARTLLISEVVSQAFAGFVNPRRENFRQFWKHSITTGVMTRLLADETGYSQRDEAYLAGLLHDVGRIALLATEPHAYANMLDMPEDDALCIAEARTLGITHVQAGAWIIEHWKLESSMADSALRHHEPASRLTDAHPLIRLVALAEQLCEHGATAAVRATAHILFGLEDQGLDDIVARARQEVDEAAAYLGVDSSSANTPLRSAPEPAPAPMQDPTLMQVSASMQSLTILSRVARTLSEEKEDSAVIDTICRTACMLFNFNDSAVLLIDESDGSLQGIADSDQHQRLAEFAMPLAESGDITKAAGQFRVQRIEAGAATLSNFEDQLLHVLGANALMCVPLVYGRRCIGVLVGAMENGVLDELRGRESFLQEFANEVACVLMQRRAADQDRANEMKSIANDYRDASRRVAHEVGNPLSIIRNYLTVIDRKLARQEPISMEISILNEEIDRVDQLVAGLAGLVPEPSTGAVEINSMIETMVRLFNESESAPHSVTIVARTGKRPCEVEGDMGSLRQICMNLVRNAIEALPQGGHIEVINNGIVQHAGRSHVVLLIQDSGRGMPAEIMASLFAPVTSPKGNGHRGLGLSIVHDLVQKIGGRITCRSGANGTTFEIWLPLATGKA
jgi:HD-like signal output (HDOD) protein/signal transduction histidine kinase